MKQLTTEQFIEKAKVIHGDLYDYSKTLYKNTRSKLIVSCKEHGDFLVRPNDHLQGVGCPICKKSIKKEICDFINDAKKIHGEKYDYSKVEYVNNHTKVCIICPIHGEFWQTPKSHLSGRGCSKCRGDKLSKKFSLSATQFIEKAKQVHGNKYDYSKVDYINNSTKVCIICPKHGEFWQTPKDHIKGKGCPRCIESKLEAKIRTKLEEENIIYIEYCKKNTLPFLNKLSLDFYLPEYNVGIECQGEGHFKPIKHFGGNEKFEYRIKNDNIKKEICDKNNIHLLYYSNLGINYPYKVFEDENELIKTIKYEKNYKVN